MRATYHSGRKGKNGRFNPNHCDRNFNLDSEFADHINTELTPKNVYLVYDQSKGSFRAKKSDETFEELELDFYKSAFSENLALTNERYIQNRNKSRCKTMEEFYASVQTCPEESILTIGNSMDGAPPAELMKKIILEQMLWERKTFPQAVILNMAFHADEPDANLHLHMRRTYYSVGENGIKKCSQKEALLQMGLERPDTTKPESRTNNAKITHTRLCREHLIELCEKYGLQMEKEPKKGGKSLTTLKKETAEKLEALKAELDKVDANGLFAEVVSFAQMLMQKGEADIQKAVKDYTETLQKRYGIKGIYASYLKEKGLTDDFEAYRKNLLEKASKAPMEEIEAITELPEALQTAVQILGRI